MVMIIDYEEKYLLCYYKIR